MEHNKNSKQKAEVLEKFEEIHYSTGFNFEHAERLKAPLCMKTNELEAIYNLVESHVPGLRQKAVLRYEKNATLLTSNTEMTLGKKYVELSCKDWKMDDNVNSMLEKIAKMPPEWTLVQLTPDFNAKEFINIGVNRHYTNSLHLTVFNCGENQPKPFCINVDAPKDSVTGAVVELKTELCSIMDDNRSILSSSKLQTHFAGVPEKQNYYAKRHSIDNRLRMLVKDLEDLYLREWRCFLVGKYNNDIETKIHKHIKDFFRTEVPSFELDEKTLSIIRYLIKSATYLKLAELKRALQTIIPSSVFKGICKQLIQFIKNVSNELSLNEQKRHPLILIIHDSLDCFPWEMMNIFADVPVSRLPSLHIAYAIFQEHKESIRDGFKIIEKPENGTYIVNPDQDLKNMQNRILSFYEYWLPDWRGFAGCKPAENEFEDMLMSGDIFAYNGHGNGAHLMPLQKIERKRINAVVLLFGCSSTKLVDLGAPAEMYSAYQIYLIACSPCIVGNLWEVTDLDTDILATEFLSKWIPNSRRAHWINLDKAQWKKGEIVNFKCDNLEVPINNQLHEPELLKAFNAAKKSGLLSFYVTKAAIVARGIPVRISTK